MMAPWLVAAVAIAAALACGRPAVAPAQGRDAGAPLAGDDLAAAVRAFPRGEIASISNERYRYDPELSPSPLIRKIVGAGPPVDIAFAVDFATAGTTMLTLQLALGSMRASMAGRGRFALVSCRNDGVAKVRIDSQFTDDPYQLMRVARHMDHGTDVYRTAFWSCLAALDKLGWRDPTRVGRHVVLLADDAAPGLDPKAREDAIKWARSSQAELHVLRPGVPEAEAMMALYEPKRDTGVEPADLAGLFRLGRAEVLHSRAELQPAIERALAQLADSGDPVDVAMVVDPLDSMGQALGDIRRAQPVLDRFVAAPGHRLALIAWGPGSPKVTAALNSKPTVIAAALAAIRRGPLGRYPAFVTDPIRAARGLAWNPQARKAVLVLTSARAFPADTNVLDWTDTDSVSVVFIVGRQGF
jgi:hypothetical protein